MSESASQPVKLSLWMRTRRWSAQNPVTAFVWLCFMAFLLFLAMPYLYYFWARFSYKPDLVAKGQLRDYDTGEPMPGVYVAVLVMPSGHAEWPTFDIGWGSSGGGPYYCSPASAVVKTDAEGRYTYRVSHQETIQGKYQGHYAGSFYYLRAYKYGYETVDARTGKPYDENPNGYSEYKQHSIAMRKISAGPYAYLQWEHSYDMGCILEPDAERILGWLERADAIGQDAWREWCLPGGADYSDTSYKKFHSVRNRMEQLLAFESKRQFEKRMIRRAGLNEDPDHLWAYFNRLYATVPGYPWSEGTHNYPWNETVNSQYPNTRDFTATERDSICSFWKNERDIFFKEW